MTQNETLAEATDRRHITTIRLLGATLSITKWSEPYWSGIDVDVWWRSVKSDDDDDPK